MIKLKNVCFSYGEKQVLEDFSLSVENGQRICLFGESGKGKTTVLRLIMGLEKADSGEINVSGSISAVFQEDRLLPFLTAEQNISRITGEENGGKILSLLGLEKEKDAYPSALSGGMARRVALARALSKKSDIYIFDEPFTGLDGSNIDLASKVINDCTKGKTVVAVLHDKNQAQKLNCEIIEM